MKMNIFCTSTVYHDLYKVLGEYVNLLLHLWYFYRTPWNLNLQDHFPKGALIDRKIFGNMLTQRSFYA